MKEEIQKCRNADSSCLHVDIFEGVFLDSPKALTFGPQMVAAIQNHFPSEKYTKEHVSLEVHMCVVKPQRYVDIMAEAGANTFIFQ